MRLCKCHGTGVLLAATDPGADAADAALACQECDAKVVYVRGASGREPHFRHVSDGGACSLRTLPAAPHDAEDTDDAPAPPLQNGWHRSWQALGQQEHREARGIGRDKHRPRDLGDAEANVILEFQHSRMGTLDFNERNSGCSKAIWVFDATNLPLYRYALHDDCFFIRDQWHNDFPQSSSVHVLFHCQDGQLYTATCDHVVQLTTEYSGCFEPTEPPIHLYARMLRRCNEEERRAIDHFCASEWPPVSWQGQPDSYPREPDVLGTPARILGTYGRRELDEVHRQSFRSFPSSIETIYTAPPGSGKSTEIVRAIQAWSDRRVLVVTFNHATKKTMGQRLREAGVHTRAEARTLDSLCYEACGRPENYMHAFTDNDFLRLVFPNSCSRQGQQYWKKYKIYGGRGAAALLQFRLRHPHARFTACRFHSKLCEQHWGSVKAWPIKKVVEQKCCPAALRWICDRDQTLGTWIDTKWDALVVDEMQDLLSAQELRLLRQTTKPLVLVGDAMQAINGFRDEPPCRERRACGLHLEPRPPLQRPAVEWYGTYRLDGKTADLLEERFGRRMVSQRPVGEAASICWQTGLQFGHTLILCRKNVSLLDFCSRFPQSRVVQGRQLAARLKTLVEKDSDDESDADPPDASYNNLKRFASKLNRTKLASLIEHLEEMELPLDMFSAQEQPVLCTVHQAKGFECDHVALHPELHIQEGFDGEDAEEVNIRYVAFSRHKCSLTLLTSPTARANTHASASGRSKRLRAD